MAWILDILELILISRKHLISASKITGLTFRPPSTAVWQVMVDMPECGHFQSSRSVNQRVALNSFISRQSSCLTGLSHLMRVGAGKSLLSCRLLVLLKPPNHLIRQKKSVRASSEPSRAIALKAFGTAPQSIANPRRVQLLRPRSRDHKQQYEEVFFAIPLATDAR